MRLIKMAVLSVFFLFLLVTIISLFIPSHVRISKAINMVAPADSVLQPVMNLQRWHEWYPLLKELPAGDISIIQTDTGKVMQIKNTTVILQQADPGLVQASFTTPGGRTIQNGWKAITYQQSDSVTVQWYMDFKLHWYPWEKFSSILYEKMYGTTMESGLANLKQVVENHSSNN